MAGIDNVAAQQEAAKLTKVQKLAALLVMLGSEAAAGILKHLEDAEIEAVSSEMAKIGMLSYELQNEILREFTEIAMQATTSVRGGPQYTQAALERAVGAFKATNIISRVAPSPAPVAAMEQIVDLEARQIFNLVKSEQPQMIALILSYIAPDKSAQALGMLRPDLRDQVLERIATLSPTPVEVVERVVDIINQKLGARHTRPMNQTGGLKAAANMLNAMDKNMSKTLLMALEERNPELGQSIRQKMFTFEDVANLTPPTLQKILREIDMRDLAVALKTASEQLKNALLSCISKRAAETVNEEMTFMGPLKLREIEAAQLRIIDVVRRLESEGEIDLGEAKEQSDEVLV